MRGKRREALAASLRLLFPVDALYLRLLVGGFELVKLLIGRKDRVCETVTDELFCVNVINVNTLTLCIGAVIALVAVRGDALVEIKSVIAKYFRYESRGALDLTL